MGLLKDKKTEDIENEDLREDARPQRKIDVADLIAAKKRRRRKRFLIGALIALIFYSVIFELAHDLSFMSRACVGLQRKSLEAIANYMDSADDLHYINNLSGDPKSYKKISFDYDGDGKDDVDSDTIKAVTKGFKRYFRRIPNGLITSLRGSGGQKWNLWNVPNDHKAVFFYIAGEKTGGVENVYNINHKKYYICNSDMSQEELETLLANDVTTVSVVTPMRDEWFIVERTCLGEDTLSNPE